MRHSMRMLVKDSRSQDGIDDKDNDKGSKSRSQSMKEQAYNKEQRERPRPHELNDKSNLIDLMKEFGMPLKKRKKSNDEIASQSASSGKLSRKGKSISCGKYGNVDHNRKGCRVQGGGSSQAGARKVSGQATGSRKVFGQAAGSKKVFGQAVGARNVSGQAAGARKASTQPNVAQSTTNQGPIKGFQGPIAGPAYGSQRKTKKLVDL
ncbi:hypothetical protein Tco_1144671 [Tanacetum coccineum]